MNGICSICNEPTITRGSQFVVIGREVVHKACALSGRPTQLQILTERTARATQRLAESEAQRARAVGIAERATAAERRAIENLRVANDQVTIKHIEAMNTLNALADAHAAIKVANAERDRLAGQLAAARNRLAALQKTVDQVAGGNAGSQEANPDSNPDSDASAVRFSLLELS